MLTDMQVEEQVKDGGRRSAAFQGLTGKVKEAYEAGYEHGVGKVLAHLRELGVLRPVVIDRTTYWTFR